MGNSSSDMGWVLSARANGLAAREPGAVRDDLDLVVVLEVQRPVGHDTLTRPHSLRQGHRCGFDEGDPHIAALDPVAGDDEHACAVAISFEHGAYRDVGQDCGAGCGRM